MGRRRGYLGRDSNSEHEAGTGVYLQYFVPREGALLWFDMLAIPADAPRPRNAHRLIDFLMRSDVIANVTEATYYANANRAADELAPATLRQDPLVYPNAAMLQPPRRQRRAVARIHARAEPRVFEVQDG